MEEITILVLIDDPHFDKELLFLESKKSILVTTKDFLITVHGKTFRVRKENFGRIIVNNNFSMAVYCNYNRKLTHGFYPKTMAHVMKGEIATAAEKHARKITGKDIKEMEES